jgi:uncharacterized protein with FMN-binding domain
VTVFDDVMTAMHPSPRPGQLLDAPTKAQLDRIAELQARRKASAPSRAAAKRSATTASGKRRHAAHRSRMAALAASISATGMLTAYLAAADHAGASNLALGSGSLSSSAAGATTGAQAPAATTPAATTPAATSPATAAKKPTGSASTAPKSAPATTAKPATGGSTSFTGGTAQTRWGPVQVKVTITGGHLVDVVALQTPASHQRSVFINDQAVPMLRSEALQAQSANINTISGATYTSDGYAQSLQSALDQARAQGVTVG